MKYNQISITTKYNQIIKSFGEFVENALIKFEDRIEFDRSKVLVPGGGINPLSKTVKGLVFQSCQQL